MASLHSSPPRQIDGFASLTSRQREVLALIAKGKTNGQIADSLGIGYETVKTHVGEVLGKLGVDTREEAAQLYKRHQSLPYRAAHAFLLALQVARRVAIPVTVGTGLVALAVVVVLIAQSRDSGDSDPIPVAASTETATPGSTALAVASTLSTSTPGSSPCPDADPTVCDFATLIEAGLRAGEVGQRAGDVSSVLALFEAQDFTCGPTELPNEADVCFGQPDGSIASGVPTAALHSDFGSRLSTEGLGEFLLYLVDGTFKGSPGAHDDFGPNRIRLYSIAPALPQICPDDCRTLVLSHIRGPANKGDALEREAIHLTIRKSDESWRIVHILTGNQNVSELVATLRAEGPGVKRWNPREGTFDSGTRGTIYAGALSTVRDGECISPSSHPGEPASGTCLPAGTVVQITGGFVEEAGQRWSYIRNIPSQELLGFVPSDALHPW